MAIEVVPPIGSTGLQAWLAERVPFLEGVVAKLLGVPPEDVTASVGTRRLEAEASPIEPRFLQASGSGVRVTFTAVFRHTALSEARLVDFVFRTAYGTNYTSTGSGNPTAFIGNGLTLALVAELRAQGQPVPQALVQATIKGSAPAVVPTITTTTPGNGTAAPSPQEPRAAAEEEFPTTVVMGLAIGLVSLVLMALCSVWCWRKSSLVTGGRKDIGGVHTQFFITRPECQQGSIVSRSFMRAYGEGTKTIVSWHYDQDEVLRRHRSFWAAQTSPNSNSPADVVIDVDPPPSNVVAGGGESNDVLEVGLDDADGHPARDEGQESIITSLACSDWPEASVAALGRPRTFAMAYRTGAAVEYYSRTHGHWLAGVVNRTRLRPQSDDLIMDVRVGKQIRPEVPMACLRPVLSEEMPVFACVRRQLLRAQEEPSSPVRRRRRHRMTLHEVWRPAWVHGPQQRFATRTGYQVRLEDGRVLMMPPSRLRRRFLPGSHAAVFRGPASGWESVTVHAAAADMVVPPAVEDDAAAQRPSEEAVKSHGSSGSVTEDDKPSPCSSAFEGSSDELEDPFATVRDGSEHDVYSRSKDLSGDVSRHFKDREEEGQLVPICRPGAPDGEPEWVPGFLLRHPTKATADI
uniref:Uncharacterized protein n=1 Tax=Alexandrium monilatum TaxID=311494 RepID=A0A7S4QNU0_9DINO